jgi:hypothetical protein
VGKPQIGKKALHLSQRGGTIGSTRLSWEVDGHTVTGSELLKRATFYKVGHHGSHNATAKRNGLAEMKALRQAMIPVDHAEAVKKHWVQMPLPEIVDALKAQTDNGVVLADSPLPAGSRAVSDPLFYELTIP